MSKDNTDGLDDFVAGLMLLRDLARDTDWCYPFPVYDEAKGNLVIIGGMADAVPSQFDTKLAELGWYRDAKNGGFSCMVLTTQDAARY